MYTHIVVDTAITSKKTRPPLRKGNDVKGSIQSFANVTGNDGEDANL